MARVVTRAASRKERDPDDSLTPDPGPETSCANT